jgi:polysaccharide export outer membrane protein
VLFSAEETDYVIGTDDVLEIFVWQNENLCKTLPVRPDGKLSLPLVGDVAAAGYTTEQLAEEIGVRLKVFIKQPEVSVMVLEFNSLKVSVMGEVKTPGLYNIRKNTTLVEVVSMAGGFSLKADMHRIKVIRRSSDKPIYVNFLTNKGDWGLENGDIIIINRSFVSYLNDAGTFLIAPVVYGVVQLLIITIAPKL